MNTLRSVFCCLFLVSCLTAEASPRLYRCTDTEGNIEFQQTRCSAGKQDAIEVIDTRVGWVPPRITKKRARPGKRYASNSASSVARQKRDRLKQERSCWKARQNLEQTENRLRRGYKASAGDRLRSRRDRHESYLNKFC